MQVLFVNPPSPNNRKVMRNFDCTTESKGKYLFQPYDFLLLSSSIPQNWNFKFIDFVAQSKMENDSERLKILSEFRPDILVMAMANTLWDNDLSFLKKIRKNLPRTKILVFGDSFTEDQSITLVSDVVDGVLSTPLDFNFQDFLSNKEVKGLRSPLDGAFSGDKTIRQIEIGRPRHESFLSSYYRWPFSKRKIYTTIFTSWGCPYRCGYCVVGNFPNYHRPWEEIIREMDFVHSLGIKEIYIGDRSFGLPYKNIERLLNEMIKRQYHFTWSTYFHPNQYTPKLLSQMKKAGCHTIVTGIESKKQESVKKFGRNIRDDQLNEMLIHAKNLGVNVCGDFILGLPGEDESDVLNTIKWSVELPLDYASFNVATPLPGTKLRELAIERGVISAEDKHFDSSGYTKIMPSDMLSSKQLRQLSRFAVFQFYGRPSYWVERMTKIDTPDEFFIQFDEMTGLIKNFFR